MKKGKRAILAGTSLLALVLYPFLRNAWDMHCLDAKARCLRDIYVSLIDANTEAEAKGQKYTWPQTLSELLDEKQRWN